MRKIIFKTVLLTVALVGTMASCQKEEISSEMVVPSHEMSQNLLAHINTTLRYWIDGVEHYREFVSQQEMDNYISYLIGLTHEGRKVTIGGSEKPSLAPEDDVIGQNDVYFWDPLIKEYSIGRFSWTMEGSNNN